MTEQEYWDKAATDPNVAQKYIADVPVEACLAEILPALARYSILEIGCGIGRLTTALAKKLPDCQIHGVDISTKMLDLTPKSNVKYRANNGRSLPYADQSFDSVYSMLVFQHIPDNGKVSYIKEAYRVLKGGGVLRIQYVLGDHHGDIDHNTTEEKMVEWFKAAGFKIASLSTGELHHQWGWITGIKP